MALCEQEDTAHWLGVTRHDWHNVDTDDDLSDDDKIMPGRSKLAQGNLSEPESTTDGESLASSSPPCQSLEPTAAPLVSTTPVDLLDFGTTSDVLQLTSTATDLLGVELMCSPAQNVTRDSLLDF